MSADRGDDTHHQLGGTGAHAYDGGTDDVFGHMEATGNSGCAIDQPVGSHYEERKAEKKHNVGHREDYLFMVNQSVFAS